MAKNETKGEQPAAQATETKKKKMKVVLKDLENVVGGAAGAEGDMVQRTSWTDGVN